MICGKRVHWVKKKARFPCRETRFWLVWRVLVLFLDVGQFESESFLLVHHLEDESDGECCYAEACEHDERPGVVVLRGVGDAGVGLVEHFADEQREEPQADVLNPEDERVGGADDFGVNELGHAGPKGGRHEREAGAEDEDGEVGDAHSSDGVALELGQDGRRR